MCKGCPQQTQLTFMNTCNLACASASQKRHPHTDLHTISLNNWAECPAQGWGELTTFMQTLLATGFLKCHLYELLTLCMKATIATFGWKQWHTLVYRSALELKESKGWTRVHTACPSKDFSSASCKFLHCKFLHYKFLHYKFLHYKFLHGKF